MPWLRIDDGFPEHRKLLALKRSERWTWVEVMCYCARQNNCGTVPARVGDVVRGATPRFVQMCIDVGLIDETDEGLKIHDWLIYNGDTIEAKVAAYLSKFPDASANDVQRAIGGKRELVLEVVRRYQEAVPDPVPEEPVTEPLGGSLSGSLSGTEVVHARAHPIPIDNPFLPSTSTTDPPSQPNGKEGRTEHEGNFIPPVETILKDVPL